MEEKGFRTGTYLVNARESPEVANDIGVDSALVAKVCSMNGQKVSVGDVVFYDGHEAIEGGRVLLLVEVDGYIYVAVQRYRCIREHVWSKVDDPVAACVVILDIIASAIWTPVADGLRIIVPPKAVTSL